tara:strand:+ start:16817 stop:18502 length:1686 start_codon:yes stop_codon:yes gene_type:complete
MSALAITRSLGRQGIQVILASPEKDPIASRSRYVHAYHQYSDPSEDCAAFLDQVAGLIERYQPDLVIPVTEKTLIPLSEQRKRFADLAVLALPPADALVTVLDKQATAELALSLQIPTPAGIVASDAAGLLDAAQQTGFPVVIKPIRSVSRQTGAVGPQLTVTYAFDLDELQRVARPLLEHGEVVIQEYFRGEGVGIELIANKGEICYAFQHRRLHEMPLSGGGSSLRESTAISPALLAAAKKLIAALNWQGVAMVEFKQNPISGEFRLVEINGRFWGSLPLSVAAGADFPLLAWELYTGRPLTALAPARAGVTCRDLAKDLYWHEYVVRRVTDSRLFSYPSKGRVLLGILGVFSPRHHFDSWNLRDLRPGLAELTRILGHYRDRIRSIVAHRAALKRQRKAWSQGDIKQQLATAKNVLILCYGNINRSAAAHAYVAQKLKIGAAVNIVSAGFHPHAGRPSDPSMVATSAQQGVDLQAFRSKMLTPELLAQSDIIFVMEIAHIERIAALDPEAVARCYLWGAALDGADEGSIEIADPYGKPLEAYQRCFSQLTRAADRIFP